jgi:hypothetical protein
LREDACIELVVLDEPGTDGFGAIGVDDADVVTELGELVGHPKRFGRCLDDDAHRFPLTQCAL